MAVEEMAVGAEGRSGIQVMAGGVMVMGRLGLRRMAARAMPLAVGADGRWDGATGGVLVVMVAGGCWS